MHNNDMDTGPVWADPDSSRRFGSVLAKAMTTAMLAVAAISLGVGIFLGQEREANERATDLSFSAVAALTPESAIAPLLQASGRRGWIVNFDGSVVDLTPDPSTQSDSSWLRSISIRSNTDSDRQFVTVSPEGIEWSHVAVAMPQQRLLVTGRTTAEVLASRNQIVVRSLAIGLAALVLTAASWCFLYIRIVRPMQLLVAAGDDLRVRGEIRTAFRDDIKAIGRTPLELNQLSNVLQVIEADAKRSFDQASGLLQAASVLGGSLDPDEVIAASLEHLQGLIGIDRSALLRFNARLKIFEVVATRGHTREYLREVTSRVNEPSLPSVRALRDNQPVQVPDTEAEVVADALRHRARRHGYRSLLAVPLGGHLKVPTVLVLHSNAPRAFSFDEIELSKSFASIAGAALRNAELFELTDDRLRTQTSRLEAIVESVDQGLIVESAEGELLFINSAIRRLLPRLGDDQGPDTTLELLSSIFRFSPQQSQAIGRIDELSTGGSAENSVWCDVEVPGPPESEPRTFRVRKFLVRDGRGNEIGRGQTWLDISEDRRLEQMKSGLLAAVSHEFRTPLTLIKGYATTLLAEDVSWTVEDQREFLQLVSREADRLTTLVQRLLDMRRIDAGMVALEKMPVTIGVLVESALESLPHHSRRIRVGDLPHVILVVDAARMVTALRNLLDNACRYSPVDELVEITATVTVDTVEVSVRDHGPGVASDVRDRIFDTFVRGQTGLESEHGGVGIGLSIARGFIEAHGGRLRLQEPSDGRGAEFIVALPPPRAATRTEEERE